MIGKRILFFEVRQDPNTDRVLAQIPHTGTVLDKIRVKGETKYLVKADDRDKPFELYPEDIEAIIPDQTTASGGRTEIYFDSKRVAPSDDFPTQHDHHQPS